MDRMVAELSAGLVPVPHTTAQDCVVRLISGQPRLLEVETLLENAL